MRFFSKIVFLCNLCFLVSIPLRMWEQAAPKVGKGSEAVTLQPLISILQDLAEPVSYGFMIKGFLQIMAGDDHAGQKTIKSAIGGFLGIQFIPKVFAIIKGVKI